MDMPGACTSWQACSSYYLSQIDRAGLRSIMKAKSWIPVLPQILLGYESGMQTSDNLGHMLAAQYLTVMLHLHQMDLWSKCLSNTKTAVSRSLDSCA